MMLWPSLIVIARAVAESIPPDRRTTAVSAIGPDKEADAKGLASRGPRGRAFQSPVRIDRRAGPRVDGPLCPVEAPPTARSHVLRGRAGTPPVRRADPREVPGTTRRGGSIPRGPLRGCPRRKPGTPRPLRGVLPADNGGLPAGPCRHRSG